MPIKHIISHNNVISFPLGVRYRIYGIHRDGQIIIEQLNVGKRFILSADDIVADKNLLNEFSTKDITQLYQVVIHDAMDRTNTLSQQLIEKTDQKPQRVQLLPYQIKNIIERGTLNG